MIVLLIGIFVTVFAVLLVVGATLAIPLILVAALVLLTFLIGNRMEKIHQSKTTSVYAEQLKELSPDARFMLEVDPLVHQEIHGVEHKMKLLEQVRSVALKHGLNLDERKASHIYFAGYQEIQKAQEAFVMAQENSQKLMFYVLLRNWDGYPDGDGIRSLVNGSFSTDTVAEALDKTGLAKTGFDPHSIHCFRALTDEEKLLAIRSFDEGKAVFKKVKKAHKLFPPYYPEWLINEPCETNDLLK